MIEKKKKKKAYDGWAAPQGNDSGPWTQVHGIPTTLALMFINLS